jgi:spore photoproduct lyase
MKRLRRMEPDEPAVQFPYVNRGGVYQYPPALQREMESYLIGELSKRMGKEKIYHE